MLFIFFYGNNVKYVINKKLESAIIMKKINFTLLAIAMLASFNSVQADALRFDDVLNTQYHYGDTENYSVAKYYGWVKGTNGYELKETDSTNYNVAYYLSKSVPSIYQGEYNGIDPDAYDINANFVGNNAGQSPYQEWSNGQIYSADWFREYGDITGDFVGTIKWDNWIKSPIILESGGKLGDVKSVAIANPGFIEVYSEGIVGDISGVFIGNYSAGEGGVIRNNGVNSTVNRDKSIVGDISGLFIGNNAAVAAGAILNNQATSPAVIGNIKGDFIGNYAGKADLTNNPRGGAICNWDDATIKSITGNFIDNYAQGETAYGGAIANMASLSKIGDITGSFIGNKVIAPNSRDNGLGGAIHNEGTIEDISGNFISNSATSSGGAIFNKGTIASITGTFENNTSGYSGAAIENKGGTITSIDGTFINNKTTIGSNGSIGDGGGAIANNNGLINSIVGEFYNNESSKGAAVANSSDLDYGYSASPVIGYIKGYFEGNKATQVGGALYNTGEITTIENSSFVGNVAGSDTTDGKGGAIYTTADLNMSVDNANIAIQDNYTLSNGEKDDNAIYIDNSEATLTLNIKNSGTLLLKDNIDGLKGYNVDVTGDNTGILYLFNDLRKSDFSVGDVAISTINNQIHNYNLNSLTVHGDTKMAVDVDIQNKVMDRFTADSYGAHNGNIIVDSMNILQHTEREKTYIDFAESGLKDNVATTITEVYSPIYRYDVEYLKNSGQFLFSRGGGKSSFNPSVLSTPVNTQSGAQAGINETFRYVFAHADAFTQFPMHVRFAKMNANKYALSTNFNNNLPSFNKEINNKGVWTRPYTTFETMNLKNGPSVDAVTYGTLFGFDSDFRELKNGWTNVLTGYVGYNGSLLNYGGADTTMNGGMVGFTETFYKNHFWTALTLSAGASVGETRTMYGKEDFTTLLAGLGSKTGYNFEFKEGKYIIQPIMFLSYTFVNTFDYTTASGVSVESSPLHTIQLNPSVRFITNFENGWQPYASVGMVWNVFNESKVMADNVRLPQMTIKPYVEYGLGIQRNWADKFTAFFQTMIRNGGRNGVALTAGFRWALGSEPEQEPKKKQVLKEAI